VRTGRKRQKRGSASMLCTVAGWVCGEPGCMRGPSQGPHGGGAERCYTGNEPHETCLLHTRPMWSPGVAWGVDPVTILTIRTAHLQSGPACYVFVCARNMIRI
jgi:hypothetical protein